jgi:hypothetical protein
MYITKSRRAGLFGGLHRCSCDRFARGARRSRKAKKKRFALLPGPRSATRIRRRVRVRVPARVTAHILGNLEVGDGLRICLGKAKISYTLVKQTPSRAATYGTVTLVVPYPRLSSCQCLLTNLVTVRAAYSGCITVLSVLEASKF